MAEFIFCAYIKYILKYIINLYLYPRIYYFRPVKWYLTMNEAESGRRYGPHKSTLPITSCRPTKSHQYYGPHRGGYNPTEHTGRNLYGPWIRLGYRRNSKRDSKSCRLRQYRWVVLHQISKVIG